MKTILTIAAILLLSGTAMARKLPKPLDIAVYAASEFDGATTYAALQDCGSRCYEANPMLRPFADTPAIFPVMAGSAMAVNWMAGKLRNGGHPRYGKGLQLFAIGLHLLAGAHNLEE